MAIYELIQLDILDIQFMKSKNKNDVICFILNNINIFVIGISEVEFFFNIRKDKIAVNEKSVSYGYLIRKTNSKKGVSSYYTRDYNQSYIRYSYGIIYDREAKLIKDNQIARKTLENNPFKMRLEFRLTNIASDWMHIDNLEGSFKRIIQRHLNYLAILYKNYFFGHIDIDASENKYLGKIIDIASNTDKVRYTNQDNELKKHIPIDNALQSLYNIERKNEEISELERKFYLYIGNMKNDKNYTKMMCLLSEIAQYQPENHK